jgi:hypothetical protein
MQTSFVTEVSHEIKNFKNRKGNDNLNHKALENYRRSGIAIAVYRMRNGLTGASKINPLERLLKKEIITQQEFGAACKYIDDFELAHMSHHARPSYDGTPISSVSSNFIKERTIPQHQLNAAARIEKIKQAIEEISKPRQIKNFKDFKNHKSAHRNTTRDRRLTEVLDVIFEKQMTINAAEQYLHIGHRSLEEKIKEICEIILEF